MCEKILTFGNIRHEYGFGFYITPFHILFKYSDDKFHEKTAFFYKKETIDKVSKLLREAIKENIIT